MSRPPGYFNGKGQPRVIRKVAKKDAKGRPKVARDSRLQIDMERITARTTRLCAGRECPMPDGEITPSTEYATVKWLGRGRRVGSTYIPDSHYYHFDCVPPEARPLVRLLVPCNWRAFTVPNEDTGTVRWFTSVVAWEAWVDKTYPDMRKMFYYNSDNAGGATYQLGTNYHWSALYYRPRFQKP